ncbi:MAG: nucleoside phosphorylase [Owenweeksia sp.]|nr:nucleoside phosphorylase [Owenweeksia sp.]
MERSELIQNEDGSVYHLALMPEQVGEVIITVGDPARVSLVSAHFDQLDYKRQNREFCTHTGRLGSKNISVISTGIGTDNIDIVVNELHYLHVQKFGSNEAVEPLQFIRLGTSGSVSETLPVNSVLLSEVAVGLGGLLHFYPWQNNKEEVEALLHQDERWRSLPYPYAALAGQDLLPRFKNVAYQSGVTLTAPGFYGPQGRHVNLPPRVPAFLELLQQSNFKNQPFLNIEMETAGLYGLSTLLGHQSVSLSAVLANRATGDFSSEPHRVVQQMISAVMEVVGG